jgi:hypothetical protein
LFLLYLRRRRTGLRSTTFGVVGSPFSPSGQFLALLRFPAGAEGRAVRVGEAPDADPLPFAEVWREEREAHPSFCARELARRSTVLVVRTAGARARAARTTTSSCARAFSALLRARAGVCFTQVLVVDLWSGTETVVAKTRGWAAQSGAHVQWGVSDAQLFYNDVVHGERP